MGMTAERQRLSLFGVGVVGIICGVGLTLGVGPAVIVAGLVAVAVAVAWAYVAVTSA
jgi:hypothetical protein